MKHPVLDCLLIIALVLSALVFLVIVIWPFRFIVGIAAIGLEPYLVQSHIENPYVDEGFSGWKEVYFEERVQFKIPNDWNVQSENGVFTIVDSSGSIWAYGATVGKTNCTFKHDSQFLQQVRSVQPTKIEYEPFLGSCDMEESYFIQAIVQHEQGVENIYCPIFFINTDSDFLLLISEDLAENSSAFDIAEAMMFSYAFDR